MADEVKMSNIKNTDIIVIDDDESEEHIDIITIDDDDDSYSGNEYLSPSGFFARNFAHPAHNSVPNPLALTSGVSQSHINRNNVVNMLSVGFQTNNVRVPGASNSASDVFALAFNTRNPDQTQAEYFESIQRHMAFNRSLRTERKKMELDNMQEKLDKMFDKQLEEQYRELPDIDMPYHLLKDIELFDYQVQGIKWLVKKETVQSLAPFYEVGKFGGKDSYYCKITQSYQSLPPRQIKGSLLCDAMGLGKSIQTICLILASPPNGVEYKTVEDEEETIISMPPESRIRSATVKVLKDILKAADLEQSGRKEELVQRIMDSNVNGKHFPPHMLTDPVAGSRCTILLCPVSVMGSWIHQVDTHIQEGVLSVRLFHGPDRNDVLKDVRAGLVDILLVSYHTLGSEYVSAFGKDDSTDGEPRKKKTRRETIFDIDFFRIVLDEAHTIRNSKTSFFKAVKEIKSEYKLGITGTPFVNRSDDIYSLLSFLGVQPFDNEKIFKKTISKPIERGSEIGLTRLRTCMGFISLRRSKESTSIKLVDKEVNLCSVEFLDDANKRTYEALYGTLRVALEAILRDMENNENQTLKNYSHIFEKILRLRQCCCSGELIAEERRDAAIKVWDELKNKKGKTKLSGDEALQLLERLQAEFKDGKETEKLPECGICLSEMEESDGIILKNCQHVFCKNCIQHVLTNYKNKCPFCRVDFVKEDVIDMSTLSKKATEVKAAKESKTEEKMKNEASQEAKDKTFGTSPKIRALLEAIQSMKADEKGVIFSQFTGYLDMIEEAMEAAGHSFVRIDGSVSATNRISRILSFNSNDLENSPRFILCSLLSSGTGINLTRGNYAFMMDCWWNEAIETQAMDRIHRINQTRKVTILRFIMKDSIEERIIELQEKKSLQAQGIARKLTGDEKRKALLGNLRSLLSIPQDPRHS